MNRKLIVAGTLLVPALLLTGCSASGGANSSVPALESGLSSADRSSSAQFVESGSSENTVKDEAVIVTGQISLVAEDLQAVSAELTTIVAKAAGRIESRSEQPETDYSAGYASFTVRIPNDHLDAFIASAKALGDVQSISIDEQDVSLEYTDLSTRVNALEAGIGRLTQLLATASTTESLITIENAITDRQMQLDSLKGQLNSLEDQVAESTITVQLNSEGTAESLPPEDFVSGLGQGWDSLVGFVVGLTVGIGILIPWLLPLGLIGGITWYVIRKLRSKKSAKSSVKVTNEEVLEEDEA